MSWEATYRIGTLRSVGEPKEVGTKRLRVSNSTPDRDEDFTVTITVPDDGAAWGLVYIPEEGNDIVIYQGSTYIGLLEIAGNDPAWIGNGSTKSITLTINMRGSFDASDDYDQGTLRLYRITSCMCAIAKIGMTIGRGFEEQEHMPVLAGYYTGRWLAGVNVAEGEIPVDQTGYWNWDEPGPNGAVCWTEAAKGCIRLEQGYYHPPPYPNAIRTWDHRHPVLKWSLSRETIERIHSLELRLMTQNVWDLVQPLLTVVVDGASKTFPRPKSVSPLFSEPLDAPRDLGNPKITVWHNHQLATDRAMDYLDETGGAYHLVSLLGADFDWLQQWYGTFELADGTASALKMYTVMKRA